jgi:uncharacterized protein YPO0396
MTIKQCLYLPLATGLLLTASCGESRTAAENSPTSARAAEEKKLRREREEARRALDKRLDEIDKELDRMNESIAKASKKAQRESRHALARLREDAREARAKPAGLSDAASERWTDVKGDVQSALRRLEDG